MAAPNLVQQFDLSVYVSLAFLFGVASQFKTMQGEFFLRRITSAVAGRVGMLFAVIAVTALFSPLILNDVVILILTPVLIAYAKDHRTDIAPLLVAEVTFTNIASSLTPLGNPQNILLWNESAIPFFQFVEGTAPAIALSGLIGLVVFFALRRRVSERDPAGAPTTNSGPGFYLLLVILVLVLADFTGLPAYAALGLAFVVGFAFNRRSFWRVGLVFDVRSLMILYAFITSISLLALAIGPTLASLASPAANGTEPYSALFMAGVSAVISNVPATQLVLSVATVSRHIAPKLAVEAGLAGNIDPISSFANILALLMVRRAGLGIRRTVILQVLVGVVTFLPALL